MKNSCLLLLGLLTVITVSTVNAVAANLVGRVLDDTGLPVSHTWVVAYEPWQGLEEETLMDAQGRFDLSLPGGTWQFRGDYEEFDLLGLFPTPAAVVLTNSETRTNFVWTLRRANARLSGRAVDVAGTPVRHTWVTAWEGHQGFNRTVLTDAAGGFDFDLGGGTWQLTASDFESLSAQHLLASQPTVVLADGETRTEFVWVMRRANAHLLLRVLDDTGTPVSRLHIFVYEINHNQVGLACMGRTDADGWCDLGLVEGSWQFSWDDYFLRELNLFASPTTVTLTNSETRTNLWVLRRANTHLHGQLVDDAGMPVSHLEVYASEGPEGYGRQVLADAEGRFDFDLVGGAWRLESDPQKSSWLNLAVPPMALVLTNGETRSNVVWVLPRARAQLRGRVADNQGIPVGHLRIVACEQNQGAVREGMTDADGQFDLPLASGLWQIRGDDTQLAIHGLFAPKLEVDLRQGQIPTNVIWTLARASTRLRGQVLDDAGMPVGRSQVSFYEGPQGFFRASLTDDAGWYDVKLVGGTWQLAGDTTRLEALKLFATRREVVLANGEPQTNVVWRLQRANARLEGRVLDDMGAAVGGAWLSAYDPQQGLNRSLVTAADGRFEFALVAGTWQFHFNPSTWDSVLLATNLVVAVTNGQAITSFIYPVWRAPWRITGFVRDTQGKPLAGVLISASSNSNSRGTRTDDHGRYQLPAVDGVWSVSVSASDLELNGCETPLTRSATISGADVELDITAVAKPTAGSLVLVGFDPQRSAWLRLTGRPGLTYQFQASTNLMAWPSVRSVTLPIVGSSDLSDTEAVHLPRRFYRVLAE